MYNNNPQKNHFYPAIINVKESCFHLLIEDFFQEQEIFNPFCLYYSCQFKENYKYKAITNDQA